jgi:hypothetical protein
MMIVTKGNKSERSVKFNFEPSCENCKLNVKKAEEYFKTLSKEQYAKYKRGELCDCYANMWILSEKRGKNLPYLKVIPDFNSCGIITHWHIQFVDDEVKEVEK